MKHIYMLRYFFFLLLSICGNSFAQTSKNNQTWRFGTSSEIKFDNVTNIPTVNNASGSRVNYNVEGCAIANDPITGDVLFATDGTTVYNSANQQMANGNALGGINSNTTAQAAAISVVPDCTNKLFYIFTNTANHNGSPTTPGVLSYSIVDMTQNGGLGAVIIKNQVIRNDLDEGMLVVANTAENKFWLVSKVDKINNYIVISIPSNPADFAANTTITPSPPPASSGVASLNNTFSLSYSKAAKKIALALWSPAAVVATVAFDESTGAIGACQIIDRMAFNGTNDGTTSQIVDCEFSPDGSKLYTGNLGAVNIYQYDLSQSPIVRTVVFNDPALAVSGQAGGFKLGPDGAIYYRFSVAAPAIHKINKPNLTGALCQFQQNVLSIPSAAAFYNFPEHAEFLPPKTVTIAPITPASFCRGDSVKLTATAVDATGFLWSTNATSSSIQAKTAGTYTCEASFFGGSCKLTSTAATVTLFPNVLANAGANQQVQCGQTKNLLASASGGSGSSYTFKWINGPATAAWTNRGAGEYQVVVTDGNTCKDTSKVMIRNLAPSFNIDSIPDRQICKGKMITIIPIISPPLTTLKYKWNDPNNTKTAQLTIVATSSATYTIEVTDTATSCKDSRSVNITASDPKLKLVISGDTAFCTGKGLIIKTDLLADSYSWNTGSTDSFITVTDTGKYSVMYSKDGCPNVPSDTITVKPAVVASATADMLAIPCGTSTTARGLAINGSGQYAYKWINGPAMANYTNVSAGSYKVIVTDVIKKCTDTASVQITNSNPTFTLTFPVDTTGCFGTNMLLMPKITPQSSTYTYLWSDSSRGPSLTVGLQKDSIITLRVADAAGCTDTRTLAINVDTAIARIVASGPLIFCEGDSVVLKSAERAGSYVWNATTFSDSLVVKKSGTYTLEVTSGQCKDEAMQNVMVKKKPAADFMITADGVEVDSVALDAATITFINKTGTASSEWNFGDDPTVKSLITSPMHTYKTSGQFAIQLIAKNNGCVDTATKVVNIINDALKDLFVIRIPEAFTPNGDTFNDVLNIVGVGTKKVRMGIFNRWGNLVFATDNILLQWDGNDLSGQPCPDGAYAVILEATSNSDKVKIFPQAVILYR